MSDEALKGNLTFISAHVFNATEDWTVTAEGDGDESSLNIRLPNDDWGDNHQPADKEVIIFDVVANERIYATKVKLKIHKKRNKC